MLATHPEAVVRRTIRNMTQPGGVQLITSELIGGLVREAARVPRLRINHNFHARPADNPQRFLNVMARGTYIRPHRHVTPPKPESFLVLEGYVVFFLFRDDGSVDQAYLLGSGPLPERVPWLARGSAAARGIDLPPGAWHSLTAVTDCAVCYEVKPGPWDAASDKDFAPWAPPEGSPEVRSYLEGLMDDRGES